MDSPVLSVQSPRFAAKRIGQVQVGPDHRPLQLVQVDPYNPVDLLVIKQLQRLAKTQKPLAGMVPLRPGIDHQSHVSLLSSTLEAADQSLWQWTKEAPIFLLALEPKHQLTGLCLAHRERLRSKMQSLYTTLPLQEKQDSQVGSARHTGIERLVSLAGYPYVGQALLAVLDHVLPNRIERLDLSAKAPFESGPAVRLYRKFGLTPREELLNKSPVANGQEENQGSRPIRSFQDMFLIPMSGNRASFRKAAETIREKLHFEPQSGEFDLRQLQLPCYEYPLTTDPKDAHPMTPKWVSISG